MIYKTRPTPAPTRETTRAWQRTVIGELSPPVNPRLPTLQREAIQGLDVHELESETVFDRLFGDAPKPAR
jgi:hypothetical protein